MIMILKTWSQKNFLALDVGVYILMFKINWICFWQTVASSLLPVLVFRSIRLKLTVGRAAMFDKI